MAVAVSGCGRAIPRCRVHLEGSAYGVRDDHGGFLVPGMAPVPPDGGVTGRSRGGSGRGEGLEGTPAAVLCRQPGGMAGLVDRMP